MTIDEAIKSLENSQQVLFEAKKGHFHDAIQLGVEALKAIKVDRSNLLPFRSTLLPGETES
jgi:hypothetical protein